MEKHLTALEQSVLLLLTFSFLNTPVLRKICPTTWTRLRFRLKLVEMQNETKSVDDKHQVFFPSNELFKERFRYPFFILTRYNIADCCC